MHPGTSWQGQLVCLSIYHEVNQLPFAQLPGQLVDCRRARRAQCASRARLAPNAHRAPRAHRDALWYVLDTMHFFVMVGGSDDLCHNAINRTSSWNHAADWGHADCDGFRSAGHERGWGWLDHESCDSQQSNLLYEIRHFSYSRAAYGKRSNVCKRTKVLAEMSDVGRIDDRGGSQCLIYKWFMQYGRQAIIVFKTHCHRFCKLFVHSGCLSVYHCM